MEHDDVIKLDDSGDDEFVYHSPDQQTQTPLAKRRKKPSVSTSWSDSAINNLIMAVEEHPSVWVYSCPEYKDRNKREQAWREIETKCPGHTLEDCKAKWANIKTAFQNVKKKMEAKYGQEAENMQPHWSHWTAMQFYNRHSTSKSSCTVLSPDVQEPHLGNSSMQISSPPETSNSSLAETSSSAHTEAAIRVKADIFQRAPHIGPSSAQIASLPETANSSLAKTANSSHPEAAMRAKADILQRAMKCLEAEEDNWHTIGMYLASQMREIAKRNKRAANILHLQLVKTAMEANLEVEDED